MPCFVCHSGVFVLQHSAASELYPQPFASGRRVRRETEAHDRLQGSAARDALVQLWLLVIFGLMFERWASRRRIFRVRQCLKKFPTPAPFQWDNRTFSRHARASVIAVVAITRWSPMFDRQIDVVVSRSNKRLYRRQAGIWNFLVPKNTGWQDNRATGRQDGKTCRLDRVYKHARCRVVSVVSTDKSTNAP